MSLLERGGRRTRRSRVLVTVLSLAAFQVLAVIGAGSASAVPACTYNPATDTINITLPVAGDAAYIGVETAADDLDPDSPPGAILFAPLGAFPPDFDQGAGFSSACGSATNSNTVAIIVLGSPNGSEFFGIDENSGGQFATSIAWAIDMGGGAADQFEIDLSDGIDNTVVLTDTSFTLNGGGGELNGVEDMEVFGDDGDDTLDGSAVTSATTDLFGGAGDDFVAPGSLTGDALDGDVGIVGGVGTDTLSYGTRTTCTVIDNAAGIAGLDANCDGDLADVGDEVDTHANFEIFQSGSGNDTLIGSGAVTETFIPGDGDDVITGQAADWLDWSSSSAGMLIDLPNLTATGQGTDMWTGIVRFVGSAFDDTLLSNTGAPGPDVAEFFGGTGVDTVDGSGSTGPVFINLDILDPSGADDLENVIGGPFSDSIHGNDLRNTLDAGDGDDLLDGQPGNDVLIGGPGNDTFSGGSGADKISYQTNTTAGVTVDMNLGFATSSDSGDDGFLGPGIDVEIVTGSPFNDSITGGGGLVTINFLFSGGNGKDTLTGSGSNDTLRGGKGNDRLRGLEGGDTLKGGPGKKDRGWGGGGVDFCSGVEIAKSC